MTHARIVKPAPTGAPAAATGADPSDEMIGMGYHPDEVGLAERRRDRTVAERGTGARP